MHIKVRDWKKLNSINKKIELLSAYIENLIKKFHREGQNDDILNQRIKEAQFILDLLKERTA